MIYNNNIYTLFYNLKIIFYYNILKYFYCVFFSKLFTNVRVTILFYFKSASRLFPQSRIDIPFRLIFKKCVMIGYTQRRALTRLE